MPVIKVTPSDTIKNIIKANDTVEQTYRAYAAAMDAYKNLEEQTLTAFTKITPGDLWVDLYVTDINGDIYVFHVDPDNKKILSIEKAQA